MTKNRRETKNSGDTYSEIEVLKAEIQIVFFLLTFPAVNANDRRPDASNAWILAWEHHLLQNFA